VVIPFGVERPVEPAGVAARAEEIRRRIGQPLVLFVGRLVAYKGVNVLIEALRNSSAAAVLVGDGPLRGALETQARAAGVADRVTFAGEVSADELSALYRACDLFVLPSVTRQEAFGVVQIEAMSRARPVVSTELGTGVSWVNVHGETGLVVPPGDAGALREAIEGLVRNPLERQKMGSAAAERARSVFAVDRMVNAILALYSETGATGVRRQTVA
jgi:rhamnosyl/mannosyltransferase